MKWWGAKVDGEGKNVGVKNSRGLQNFREGAPVTRHMVLGRQGHFCGRMNNFVVLKRG